MSAAYSFVSRWRIPASADRCGRELERMLTPGAASWWPGVRVSAAPARIAVGESIALTVRSPLGYRLQVELTVTQWRPRRTVAASSSGDLRGVGRIDIAEDGADAASIVFHWDVATEVPWMTRASPVLRPVFSAAHAQVMRAGERALRRALR